METNVSIEVDERTAKVLHTRAAELGITVSELVAELASHEGETVSIPTDEIAALDRRWRNVEATGSAVPHTQVVRWLRTWGTRQFRPWPGR